MHSRGTEEASNLIGPAAGQTLTVNHYALGWVGEARKPGTGLLLGSNKVCDSAPRIPSQTEARLDRAHTGAVAAFFNSLGEPAGAWSPEEALWYPSANLGALEGVEVQHAGPATRTDVFGLALVCATAREEVAVALPGLAPILTGEPPDVCES